MTMHLHNVLISFLIGMLADTVWFEKVFEYVIRVEFQQRGTLHLHLALWAFTYPHQDLRGNSKEKRFSPFIRMLCSYGFDHVDVQYGEGFLNYINGYTAKASDAMNFRLDQHTTPGASHQWRTCYRLLCKHVMCVPEIMARFASLPLMVRSFHVEALVAPIPRKDRDMTQTLAGRRYLAYLKLWGGDGSIPLLTITSSFLQWCRKHTLGAEGPRLRHSDRTLAIGVRFAFELLDIFIGQYAAFFFAALPARLFRS